MKEILFRLLMAAALTLAAFALSSPAHGRQANEDPAPTSSSPQEEASHPPSLSTMTVPSSNPASGSDDQTQDELTFTGRIRQEKGALVLKDPITKLSYQLNISAKAKRFIGKQVKVTGKLEMKSNTIQIHTIEPSPDRLSSR